MLVLALKIGESVLIGDNIEVQVQKRPHGALVLGITAPPEIPVWRREVAEKAGFASAKAKPLKRTGV